MKIFSNIPLEELAEKGYAPIGRIIPGINWDSDQTNLEDILVSGLIDENKELTYDAIAFYGIIGQGKPFGYVALKKQ